MTKLHPMLLYDEPPIAVSPTLCRLLGLPEAVFLQQFHFRLHQKASDLRTYEKYMVDGRHWVYWTHQELLREIPIGRSTDPHKRIIKRLRNAGILLVLQLQASDWNHTNYFSIDYDAFERLIQTGKLADPPIGGNATDRSGGKPPLDKQENRQSDGGNATDQRTDTTPEVSTETTTTDDAPLELHPVAEPYRELIETIVVGVSGELAQAIADEAAGALLAIRTEGPSIACSGGFSHWWMRRMPGSFFGIKAMRLRLRAGKQGGKRNRPLPRLRPEKPATRDAMHASPRPVCA